MKYKVKFFLQASCTAEIEANNPADAANAIDDLELRTLPFEYKSASSSNHIEIVGPKMKDLVLEPVYFEYNGRESENFAIPETISEVRQIWDRYEESKDQQDDDTPF